MAVSLVCDGSAFPTDLPIQLPDAPERLHEAVGAVAHVGLEQAELSGSVWLHKLPLGISQAICYSEQRICHG